MIINLISSKNGVGLERDVNLLGSTLADIGHEVYFIQHNTGKGSKADINIFLELVEPRLFKFAPTNYLIPNPEWFYPQWKPYLRGFDKILCKTHHAVDIFKPMGFPCEFIGWASEDKYDPSFTKSFDRFLHVAGKSSMKGTNRIVECWEPDFPELVIIQEPRQTPPQGIEGKDNILYLHERLSEQDLSHWMNSIGVHLCMSEAEGFGHYIWEALSCDSLVLLTDGKPMNEIDEDFTFHVGVEAVIPEKMANRYLFDQEDFKSTIRLFMKNKIILHKNAVSRKHWELNKKTFEETIKRLF